VSFQYSLYVKKISPIQDLLNILYVTLMTKRSAFHAVFYKYEPNKSDAFVMFHCNFCTTWVMLGRAVSTAFK